MVNDRKFSLINISSSFAPVIDQELHVYYTLAFQNFCTFFLEVLPEALSLVHVVEIGYLSGSLFKVLGHKETYT